MRALDRGESFTVTRSGVPVGELTPIRPRQIVDRDAALAVFVGAPPVDHARFQKDIDSPIDQDPGPRA